MQSLVLPKKFKYFNTGEIQYLLADIFNLVEFSGEKFAFIQIEEI